jgi:ATP-dependent Lon protease
MFVTTANYIDNIPEPLIDRMKIIELSPYTELEKLKIVKEYVIPKVLEKHFLTPQQLSFTDEALLEIIKHYTRESGVRELERYIRDFARKFIVKLLNKKLVKEVIAVEKITEYLGKRIFDFSKRGQSEQIGVVVGLAYTQAGGDILPIESAFYKGKGNLILTGKLGEIMKESATLALSYLRSSFFNFHFSNEIKERLRKTLFGNYDFHIHVPEGAVPKEGPSAGITITTSLLSTLAKLPVSQDIGMTGEIKLNGEVLKIGGLKEKLISANRSGIKTVIIPIDNMRDLDDIPLEVQEKLKIIPVENFIEVLNVVFSKYIVPQIKDISPCSEITPAPRG